MRRSKLSALSVERLLFLCLCLLLLWAPLPFGSNRPWALGLLALTSALLMAAWLCLYLAGRVRLSSRVWRRARWPAVILIVLSAWVLLQTLPLPRALVETLSPRAASLHITSGWIPLSLDVAATRVYWLNSVACAAAFLLVVVLVTGERRARLLLWVLVASGLFQAVYGAAMVLTGLEWGFFVPKYVGEGVTTGTFVNRNHFAGYLVMTLAVGTGLLIAQLSGAQPERWRERLRGWLRLLMSPKIFLRLFLALMVIALVMTRSRMGNTAFFVGLAVAGIAAVLAGRKISPRLVLLLVSLLVIDIWIVGEWFGLDKVVERLERTVPTEEVRLEVSTDTTRILRDFALVGSGGGSFQVVFPYYQGLDVRGRYDHAHNDYLELASDLGIPALLLLGLFCLLAAGRAMRLQKRDASRLQQGVGFALIMVLTWLLLHSSVDFNLQIPANSVTLCAILGLGYASLKRHGGHKSRFSAREMVEKP